MTKHAAQDRPDPQGAVARGDRHIVVVVPTGYPDGLAEAEGIGRGLAEAGVPTTVVCSRLTGAPHGRGPEPQVVEVPSPMRGVADGVRFARAVASVLRTLEPALVHVYAFRGCGVLPRLAPGPRYLYDLRTGNVSGKPWASLADRLSCWEALPYRGRAIISRAVGRRVCGNRWDDAVVFPLGFSGSDAAGARVVVERRRGAAEPEPVRIGFVGGLQPQRHLDRILLVARALRDRGWAGEWIVVGDGADRPRLEGLAHKLGLSSAMAFRGAVPHHALWQQYAAMDVALAYVPSVPEYYHQPPLKTIEAMACGLPVVATDTAGNREFIHSGRDGLLARDDTEALARALEELTRDPATRDRLGRAAAERAQPYAWERIVADTVLPAYDHLLRTNG